MARTVGRTAEDLLARLRAICFGFAGTEEKLSHGAPWFHVRGKMFVAFANDHHGDGRVAAWCKATREEQQRLVASNPEVYFVPPYVGVNGWVGVRLERPSTDLIELAIVIEESWRSIVPKSLAGAAPRPPPEPPQYPTTDPDVARRALTRLTAICEALPGSTTESASSHATFRMGKKPYAYFLDNHHRDGMISACFKPGKGESTKLAQADPKRFYVPPYIGARGWVGMRIDAKRVDWKEVEARIRASFRSVAPKRLIGSD